MVYTSRLLQAAGLLVSITSVRASDYDDLCNSGVQSTDDARCWNCWDYLENQDDFKACVIVYSVGTLNCGGDFGDELDDQNQVLLELSKRDSSNPHDWVYDQGHWEGRFSLGTTAIPSSDDAFKAWRGAVADLIFNEMGEDGDLAQHWAFKIKDNGEGFDAIEIDYSCSPF